MNINELASDAYYPCDPKHFLRFNPYNNAINSGVVYGMVAGGGMTLDKSHTVLVGEGGKEVLRVDTTGAWYMGKKIEDAATLYFAVKHALIVALEMPGAMAAIREEMEGMRQ